MLFVVIRPKRRIELCRRARHAVPPERHIVGRLRNFRISGSKGLSVAVTKQSSHSPVPDKRWVAHNEVRLRPYGLPGISIAENKCARRLVGHILACDRVLLERLPVPPCHRLAVGIQDWLLTVVFENGVPAFDVVEGLDDRLCGHAPKVRKCH